jgi:hypothetical protein
MRIFIGMDERQPIAAQVLAHSIWARASRPVSITMLKLHQLPIKRTGLTTFTYTRYLVPYLCGYEGMALFMDADMLCLTDISTMEDDLGGVKWKPAVSVVQHLKRYEWPSFMYFNNAECKDLTLEVIEHGTPQNFEWAKKLGSLAPDHNHLVGYDLPTTTAKIVHFTAGLPIFEETKDCEYAKEWHEEHQRANGTVSWKELMGPSVHSKMVLSGGLKRQG